MTSLGLDVGSATVKAAVLCDGVVVSTVVLPSGADGAARAREAAAASCARAGTGLEHLQAVGFTGVPESPLGGPPARRVSELACDAKGALLFFPSARTVIDMGAECARVISVGANGRILDFETNARCASGTGLFLDTIAKVLEEDPKTVGKLALEASEAVPVTATCAVYAESEVVGLVARGIPKGPILRGVHRAVVDRIYAQVQRVRLRQEVVLIGGGARNEALRCFLSERLGCPLAVPPEPQTAAAIGAALLAAERGGRP